MTLRTDIRIRQNACDHKHVAKLESDLGTYQMCMDCGKRQDIITQKKTSENQNESHEQHS